MLSMTGFGRAIKTNIYKAGYLCELIRSSIANSQDKACPFCGALEASEFMRKFFFVRLFKCNNCGLMFRCPKDKLGGRFYRNSHYYEPKVSIFPAAAELELLKTGNFKGSRYDISDKIAIIKKYIKEGNMLDYGSSWGYGLWQFLASGFSGKGYDIAIKQAKFGRENLGLKIICDPGELDLLESDFNLIFADNALEHISDIKNELNRIYKLLKRAGYLFIFVPDSSSIDKEPWKKIYAFGRKHCLAFDRHFFAKNLPVLGFSIIDIAGYALDGCQLMVIAQKI